MDSRTRRKQQSRLDTRRGSTWWAPGAIAWWIGVLFSIGSICFALGAMPGFADAVGIEADSITFFVGSIFFTTAALLQFVEVANVGREGRWEFFTWEPRRVDWWACLVQLGGTLYFNVSTFNAMSSNLSAEQADQLVWRPDVIGSICFLVASGLAYWEVTHSVWSWRPKVLSWWIVALNMVGSIAFGVSAVGAKVIDTDDQIRNVALMNLGTFVGALCFLVAAVMLLPERTAPSTE